MNRPIKLGFQVAAFAITIAAALGIIALAVRMSSSWDFASGLSITISTLTAFFCVFAGIALSRQRTRRDAPPSTSIKDELDLRKLAASGTRIQLR